MPVDIVELLKEPRMIKVCAPMVRYSKLPFRSLVRRYDCDICFTPMIIANSFVQSDKARDNEFTTAQEDRPLVVQFAANNVKDFVNAAEIVAPYCDGVDLNSGCPQHWAMKEGYGADLLRKPELVRDLVSQVRNRIPRSFAVSVKIRLLKDMRKTVDFCQALEHAGASFLTVHGRTPEMRNEPIILDDLKVVRDCVRLPLIANGDVRSLEGANRLYEETNYEAVMAARGILTNPGLFSGHLSTPIGCIQDWLAITEAVPTQFLHFHHHLVFMMEKILLKKDRVFFNNLQSKEAVLEFLRENYGIRADNRFEITPIKCNYDTRNAEGDKESMEPSEEEAPIDFLRNLFEET